MHYTGAGPTLNQSPRIEADLLPRGRETALQTPTPDTLLVTEMQQTFTSQDLNQLIQIEVYVNEQPDYAFSPAVANFDHYIHQGGAKKSHEHAGEYYDIPQENHEVLMSSPIIRAAVEVAAQFGSRVSITGSLKSNILSFNGVTYKSRGGKRVLDMEDRGDIDLRVSIPVSDQQNFLQRVKDLFANNSEYEIKTSSSGNTNLSGVYIYKNGVEVGSIFFAEPAAQSEPEDYIHAQEHSMFSNDKGILLISKDSLQFHDPERTLSQSEGDFRQELAELNLIKNSAGYKLIRRFLASEDLTDAERYFAVRTMITYTKFIMQNLTISPEIHNTMKELFKEVIFNPDHINRLSEKSRNRFLETSLQQYCKLAHLKGDGNRFMDYLTQYPFIAILIPGIAKTLSKSIPNEYPYTMTEEPQEKSGEETGSVLIMLNSLFNNLDRLGRYFPPSKSLNLTLGFVAAASLFSHEWVGGRNDLQLTPLINQLVEGNLIEKYKDQSKAEQYGVDLTIDLIEIERLALAALNELRSALRRAGSPAYSRKSIYDILRNINSRSLNQALNNNATVQR